MRLIDADAFKKYIRDACNEMSHVYKDGGKWAKQITEDFCMDIDEQPTIEERKTGKWTNRWAQNGDQVKEVRECSECGAAYLRYYDTADGFDCIPPKYCPNCGAKMEKTK